MKRTLRLRLPQSNALAYLVWVEDMARRYELNLSAPYLSAQNEAKLLAANGQEMR